MMPRKAIVGALWLVAVTVLFFAGLFTAIPSADIDVSAMFFAGDSFLANDNAALQAFREAIWWLAILLTLFSAFMLGLMAIRRPPTQRIGTRVWGFVCLTYILAPGVLANVILKDHWGRARPRSITDFGGSSDFTPALEMADQCVRNCSFVSGEASGVIATALVLSLLIAPTLERGGRMLLLIPTWG
ncbi:MAG: phosphatase PAP2 family protein, partial [Alphaproteobacteria bacterium]|nr:phosphatase PAP2 family protein [Alphaproteobacteria bacterium]